MDKPFVYGMSVEGGNFTDRAKETTRFLKNGSPRSSCRPHDDMTAAREPPTAQDIVFHISKTVMTKSTNTMLKGIRHALDTGMLMYEMRTLLLVLLLSTTMAAALAASVDELQARRKAARFLASKGVGMPKTAKTTRAGVSVNAAVSFGQPEGTPFYVFNGDHGFAIISGDDRTAPVLGYSTTSTFTWDEAPDNLKSWLRGYADQITALRNGDAQSAANIASPGEGIASKPKIESMTTGKWDQNMPYNRHCPKSPTGGGQTVTGCVATAMAELLYYHWQKTPHLMVKETQAAMPAYDTDTPWPGNRFIHVDGIAQNSKIDWADMLPTYSQGAYTDALAEAVARLMQYCGVSVYMDYASGASGANAFHVPNALIKYFGFTMPRASSTTKTSR